MQNNPIGIIDSGVGGLSIFEELQKQLPDESFVYLADSRNCPYGNRSTIEIYNLAKKLVDFLVAKDIKLLIIACNTITVHALERLRIDFPKLPIIGIVPVVKRAAEMSKTGRIGILSTVATANSEYQKNLIVSFASGLTVINKGTDSLVPLVEHGEVSGEKVMNILQKEMQEFVDADVDCIALGCSHFPFLKASMQEILGKDVLLLDSGGAVSRQVKRVLEKNNILSLGHDPQYTFYTTGDVQKFTKAAVRLIGETNIGVMLACPASPPEEILDALRLPE